MDRRTRDRWLGRSTAVSRQLAALAAGLLGLLVAVFLTDLNTLWPLSLRPSGAVGLVALAAVVAYYNEGIVPTWLLAFAGTLPPLVFHPPRGPTFSVTPATAPVAVLHAGAAAVGLGTLGFAAGAALGRRRDRRRGERYVPSAAVLPTLFVGRGRRRAARWLAVGVAEIGVVFGVAWFGLLPFGIGGAGLVGIALLLGLMFVPAAWSAARNRGLIVSWALAFAPVFGVFLAIQLRFVASMAPDRPVLYAMGTAAMLSAPVAALAFTAGVAVDRLRSTAGLAARLTGGSG